MADYEQVPDPAQDWWTSNAPPADTFADQINALYQQYYGRPASSDEIAAHRGNPGGVGAVEQALKASQPATAAPAASGDDTQWILDALKAVGSTDDPNYWINKWKSGELGTDKNYVIGRINTGDGVPGHQSNGFGAPPNQYASNPAAPQYVQPATPANLSQPYQVQGTAPSAPNFTPYTAPTLAQLQDSPGYQARLDAGLLAGNRSAAAKGTVLNGGTQKALNRYGQDYASNEYNNLFGQGLATNQNNNSLLQTGFGDSLSSFNSTNQFGLNARQQNQNEFQQNVVQPAQQTFQNQYQSYLNENARTLNDYLTNYNIKHTAETDEWGRTNDVANRGLQAAGAGRAA